MLRWQAVALAAGALGGTAALVWQLSRRRTEEDEAAPLASLPRAKSVVASNVLFDEWLRLAGEDFQKQLRDSKAKPLCADDAIVVVDMQHDFVLKSDDNPDGGRFGVPEGDGISAPICDLIRAAVNVGATVVATRDYHPYNHCSFAPEGGPYPPHCVQGTKGAELLPDIALAMRDAMLRQPEKAHIVFKGFHEDTDSFGALPYAGPPYGEGRVTRAERAKDEGFGAMSCMGCAKAPWTGSVALQQSAVQMAAHAEENSEDTLWLNPNAPPDVLAVLDDKVDRKLRTLQDLLKATKGRVIACGLALDFCVLDTCRNARALEFPHVALCVDAARAAHIHGVGSHGSGFLQDPSWVAAEMATAGIEVVGKGALLPTASSAHESLHRETSVAGNAMLAFPQQLQPIGLRNAPGLKLELALPPVDSPPGLTGTYSLELVGALKPLARVPGFDNVGVVSPATRVPKDWPAAHKQATHICWAYPMAGLSGGAAGVPPEARMAFLSISSSAELRFAAHGGFVLLDAQRRVVQAQAVGNDTDAALLRFAKPRKWREEFTPLLQRQRLQKITLPELKARGAQSFCWLGPEEALVSGPERWVPSATGAFLYLRAAAEPPIFFPRAPGR